MKNKLQFNLYVNEEDFEIINILRDKYAINLSGSFKIYLKGLKERLDTLTNQYPYMQTKP